MSKRPWEVSHFIIYYLNQSLLQINKLINKWLSSVATCSIGIFQLTSLHVLLWHHLGLALSHWASKGSSIFAAQATYDKIKLAHCMI